jgi:predicted GTPase
MRKYSVVAVSHPQPNANELVDALQDLKGHEDLRVLGVSLDDENRVVFNLEVHAGGTVGPVAVGVNYAACRLNGVGAESIVIDEAEASRQGKWS